MSEQEAEIRALAESFSGLQYVVTGERQQWPWTSAAAANQIVDLVRAIPAILADLAAARAQDDALACENARLRTALEQILHQVALVDRDELIALDAISNVEDIALAAAAVAVPEPGGGER